MNQIHIIGAGGVGSFLTAALVRLKDPQHITVIDGDTLERKNLDRQLFNEEDIGEPKSKAMASRYGCDYTRQWYSHGILDLNKTDWLLCCVDNHPGRRSVLQSCDAFGCQAVFGANEVTSSEAYYYRREWRGTKLDPRVYYPEINTSDAGDPRAAAIGCTGEAQANNRQLVTANFMAAALMGHLFVIWNIEARKVDKEARTFLPFKLVQNLSQNQHYTVKDYLL